MKGKEGKGRKEKKRKERKVKEKKRKKRKERKERKEKKRKKEKEKKGRERKEKKRKEKKGKARQENKGKKRRKRKDRKGTGRKGKGKKQRKQIKERLSGFDHPYCFSVMLFKRAAIYKYKSCCVQFLLCRYIPAFLFISLQYLETVFTHFSLRLRRVLLNRSLLGEKVRDRIPKALRWMSNMLVGFLL